MQLTTAERETLTLERRVENARREHQAEREKILKTRAEGNKIIEDAREQAKKRLEEVTAQCQAMRAEAAALLRDAQVKMASADLYATEMLAQAEALKVKKLRELLVEVSQRLIQEVENT